MPPCAFPLNPAGPGGLDPVSVRREGIELVLKVDSGEVDRIRSARPETWR